MTDSSEKPDHISQSAWNAVDVPEGTDEDFARAKPLATIQPGLLKAWKRSKGRPTINATAKKHIGFRLAADVVDAVKASGRGYNARVEQVLRDAIAKGIL